jgi:hypothetical protein
VAGYLVDRHGGAAALWLAAAAWLVAWPALGSSAGSRGGGPRANSMSQPSPSPAALLVARGRAVAH